MVGFSFSTRNEEKLVTIHRLVFAGLLCVLSFSSLAQEQADTEMTEAQRIYDSLNWTPGPGTFDVTPKATIDLPEGYDRLDAADTKKLMELYENPSSFNEYYVAPVDERWFAIFAYEDTGYIEDDEAIDAAELLESIRQATEAGNRERRDRGWAEMSVVGWQYEPFYSDTTNRLSWAILAESGGQQLVNYNTRLLGRTGVISAVLVADQETLDQSVQEFEQLLERFEYKPGNTYAEYKPGDKTAAYGLAALITGGAAVAVAKGAGKGVFKMIGLGILAFFALLGGKIKRMFSSKKE